MSIAGQPDARRRRAPGVLAIPMAVSIATALLTAPRVTEAQSELSEDSATRPTPAAAVRFHRHDGLYLHLGLGESFSRVTAKDSGRYPEISGPMTSWIVAVGVAPIENLVVYGAFVIGGFNDASGKIDGHGVATATTTLGGVGAGIAYYFPGPNVYVGATLLVFSLEAQRGKGDTTDWGLSFEGLAAKQGDASTEPGVAVQGLLGKEWWISPRWGIGPACQVLAGRALDYDTAGNFTWTATSFSLLFSATYN
jgi:hypothetical protein